MIIVDSPFHITFSDENKSPEYACVEKCKSVYWKADVDEKNMVCEKCGGNIEEAVKRIHYTVLKKRVGQLSFKDFKKQLPKLSKKDKESLKAYTGTEAKIGLLSMVKPEFIEKAKKEWC